MRIFGDVFSRFIDRVHVAESEAAFAVAGNALAQRLGFRWFAYLSFGNGKEPELMTSYEQSWTAHYFAQRYERLDPVVTTARSRTCPFRWGAMALEAEDFASEPKDLFDDAASFGIRGGVTVPFTDPLGRVGAFTLATDERASGLTSDLDAFEGHLQAAALYFQNRAVVQLDRFRRSSGAPPLSLTPQQNACLSAVTRGLSFKEAARELRLAPRTVEFHLAAAKQRLGVRTTREAVRVAVAGHLL